MITLKELLGSHNITECSHDQLINLNELLVKINRLRADWGHPLTVTSGFRNLEDMRRIYKSDIFPKTSKHLSGLACDFSDPDGKLMAWLKENDSARMKQYGLWGELGTKGWVHVQSIPMGSYNPKTDLRWFEP